MSASVIENYPQLCKYE